MLHYSEVTRDDLEAIINLYEKYLNAGTGVKEYLRRGLEQDRYVGYKCVDGDIMVGLFSARPGIYFTYSHPELEEEIRRGWPEAIYTGDMLAIEEEYRGRGIAHILTKGCCDIVKARGGEHLLVELWVKPNGEEPAGGVIRDMGTGVFEKKWVIPDFYSELHLHGLTCPLCGDGKCACGAVVGVIKL